MSAIDARETLFSDVLTCDETRPATFLRGELDHHQVQSLCARGEALLRALAVVEDGSRGEEPEQPADHAVQRIEAKLDLLTALVAGLATNHAGDPQRSLRWSARGACLAVDAPLAVYTQGRFRVQPADWLPSPLVLPATVLACETSVEGVAVAWLRFGPLSTALDAALERHLFRVHRRAIAESRRPR